MHQSHQGATFHVEHIVPRRRGGLTELQNLAWACPACNLSKADRIDARDPETGNIVPLFNPRHDNWRDHFRWNGHEVVGVTPAARATIDALGLNKRAESEFEQLKNYLV